MVEDAGAVGRFVVWIVDDSPLERAAAQRALETDFTVHTFVDGAAALERFAVGELCDVLVLDWEMAGMSGVDVCRYIRGSTGNEKLPILLLTVHRDTERVVEGLQAGANDFQSKPFVPAELTARVWALVRSKLLRERIEQDERRRAEYAEERARLQELYLGIIGHDLRNPLGAILHAAQIVERADVTEEQRRAFGGRIGACARRMSEMIDQLLDLTRTRLGGGIAIRREPGDLVDVCRRVVSEHELAWPGREIQCVARDPGHGRWDPARIAQAISNLLANALQHGEAGTPVVLTTLAEGADAVVEVSNQGPPIAPDRVATLFEAFTFRDRGPQSEGLGLGLYIAQQIVEAHGGDISVTSDEVTRFRIRLPRDADSTSEALEA